MTWDLLAEREFLTRKGAWGEQPDEPACTCPRRCWCQGEDVAPTVVVADGHTGVGPRRGPGRDDTRGTEAGAA